MSKLVKEGQISNEQKMVKYVRDIQDKQKRDREMAKPTPYERMAEQAMDEVFSYAFWCDSCQEDFDSPAYKTVHRLFGDAVVCYRAYHEKCGEESIRLVTHRDHDPYYHLSERVHLMRGEYADDVLQADQYGFRTHYGEPFEEFERKLKLKEERIIMGYKEKGLAGGSVREQERLGRLRRR